MAKASRGSDQFVVRLPDGMRDRIKAAADKNGRSMNAEIVATLDIHFPEPFSFEKRMEDLLLLTRALHEMPGTPAVDALIEEMEKAVKAISQGQANEFSEQVRERVHQAFREWETHKNEAYSERVHRSMTTSE